MKKIMQIIVLVLLSLLNTNNIFAQKKYSTYTNDYLDKDFNIDIQPETDNKFCLYIDVFSLDNTWDKVGIMVNQKQLLKFIEALDSAKVKYNEWKNVAISNNVKKLSKNMEIKCKVDTYFSYGKWHFNNNIKLNFGFGIFEHKEKIIYMLSVNTGQLVSSSNQYMKVDGGLLTFTSLKEIDSFIELISPKIINEFLKKPNSDNLFK